MQFKQLQINPKTFRDFNGIQTHGLCVSTAVLYHLSYEDPYMPVHWKQANMLSSSQHVKGMKHRMKMRFKVRCFWTLEFACLHSQGFFTFLPSYRNMASLDSQGEIVPIELPNSEERWIWEGKYESARSR